MLSSRMQLMRISSRITKLIACCWGESFPFYYVTEYPKSGGSWLADMIADYLQIPRPVHYHLPLSFTCVIHNHWGYSPRLRRVFYLYRDGRDVVVSDYFFINRQSIIHILHRTPCGGYSFCHSSNTTNRIGT